MTVKIHIPPTSSKLILESDISPNDLAKMTGFSASKIHRFRKENGYDKDDKSVIKTALQKPKKVTPTEFDKAFNAFVYRVAIE